MIKIGLILIFILVTIDAVVAKDFVPKSFKAKFDYLVPSLRGDPNKISVDIDFNKPTDLRYEIKDPNHAVTFVCNRQKTWVYTPSFIEGGKGELKVGDSSKYCFSKIFQALNNGLTDNKVYTVKKVKKEYVLTFTKQAKVALGIDKIGLVFKDKNEFENLSLLKIYKAQNQAQIYEMKKIDKKVDFQKGHFEFTPPKNTNTTNF